jgi:thiol:disulfide interchange protein
VQTLGTVALVAAVWAIVGLVGQRSWAVLAALASALFGIAVGVIDMVHSQTRGAILSIAFAVVAVGVLVAAVPVLRSALWMRRAERQLAPVDPWIDDAGQSSPARAADAASRGRAPHQSTGSRDRSGA